MLRFKDFEALGLQFAGMTEAADGDFSALSDPPPPALAALAGFELGRIANVKQVHGTNVLAVEDHADWASLGEQQADALITQTPGLPIGVRVADCVPVFLFDPVTRSIGVVHAGRQGTYDGIAGVTVGRMSKRFAAVPENVHAVIGPSAGPCCYEVSSEMAEGFRRRGLPTDERYLDLWEANAQLLREAGVPRDQISICGDCTICVYRFHSYRATATNARNLAIIAL